MELSELVEELRKYDRIVVTGPQRSGTRIAAYILAFELGLRFIDEREIHVDSLYQFAKYLESGRVVIHAPGLCHKVHIFKHPTLAVVMVYRPIAEILESQERIDWQYEAIEQSHYGTAELHACEAKYAFWEDIQATRIGSAAYDLDYHQLSEHPFWVEKRVDFGALQHA